MAKNKNKKISKSDKPHVSESALLKSLNELEEAVLKGGDELLEQDPEGGLSTEGEPLSKKAPKGKGEVIKADDVSDEDDIEDTDDESVEKGGDDESEDDDAGSDDASEDESDDEAGDDDSSEEPALPMKKGKKIVKSIRERAAEDETMSKAIEVSEFIEAQVDTVSEAFVDLQKSMQHDMTQLSKSMQEREAYQRNFNGRLAKGMIEMGKALTSVVQLVKSLSDKPNVQMRKSVLSSHEITDPHRNGDEDDDNNQELSHAKVAEWLFEKSMAGEIDSLLVTQYEVHGKIEALPVQVRKALVNDLRK